MYSSIISYAKLLCNRPSWVAFQNLGELGKGSNGPDVFPVTEDGEAPTSRATSRTPLPS